MRKTATKIGFGGGCHWCTEAVFQSIQEVNKVEQGWIKSTPPFDNYSEGVIVHFNQEVISLAELIKIHISTHSSNSNHSMRSKYRSAIYTFDEKQNIACLKIMSQLQQHLNESLITKIIPFHDFKLNQEEYLNYYYKNPEKPFCQTYILPKLKKLENRIH
ncbi:peptide-methionine (S)-S-oxide reductase [Marivirga sp.]|uniref:peptide-methionine (S)-S-oxide reductase n=1 Tax=Marivirga sp. TaxID=2018662 RepID=UPI002D7F200A|nr:peptide-methionine (S)-S-oxide reductase [Marivirga sp.]HET8859612.1 peptide-methionine (S)-S-oxide reductase [Marivirga sp.]